MTRKTVLNDTHRALGAKMVDFGGWDMPLHYGSQLEEHLAVRADCGLLRQLPPVSLPFAFLVPEVAFKALSERLL